MIRYDVKLKLDPSTNAFRELRGKLMTSLRKVKTVCPDLTLYPWHDKNSVQGNRKLKGITDFERDLPKDLAKLSPYLYDATPDDRGKIIYGAGLYLGHSKSKDDLMKEITYWFQQNNYCLFIRPLQVDSSIIIGWGLYFIQWLNTEVLVAEILKKHGLKLGL